jgi:HEAT repeat protein
VRRNAALALTRIGPKAAAAVPALARLLATEQPEEVRLYAVEALAFISPAIEPAVPELVRVLKEDRNGRVRQRAVMALGALRDLKRPGLLPAFEAVLATTDEEGKLVRYDAAIVVGILLGPQAPDRTIDVLQEMLGDPSLRVYEGASASINTPGGREQAGGASRVTVSHSGDGRWRAVQALARIGKRAARPEVLRFLEEAVNAADEDLRKNAQVALKMLKRDGRP